MRRKIGQMTGRWAGLAAILVLAGCLEGGGLGAGAGARGNDAHAPAQVRVLSGSFAVSGPRGFCIDQGATREDSAGAFVLLGSCSAISGNPRDAKARKPAVLTASVVPAATGIDTAALDRMAAYFATDAGRAALARADGGGQVSLLDLSREPGLVLIHAADHEPAPGMSADYWRGVFDAGASLVTVTVSGFDKTPLGESAGRRLTQDFVAAIRTANAAPATEADATPAAAPGGGLSGLLGRLF